MSFKQGLGVPFNIASYSLLTYMIAHICDLKVCVCVCVCLCLKVVLVTNNLVVTNTTFKHRPCHQYTWFHPAEGGKKGHILDYILVNHRFRSSILDTRVFRNTYLQSDHRLVVSNIRLKLKVKRRITQLKQKHQTNSKLLRESDIRRYREALATSLQNMSDDVEDVEDVWARMKGAVGNAQTTALPLVDSKPEADWMTDEVRLLSLKKQQAWLSWEKNTDNLQAQEANMSSSGKGQECMVGRTGERD